MIELTETQRQMIGSANGKPVEVVDPATQRKYVLLPAECFQHMQSMLDEDDVRFVEHLLAECHPEDWEDASNYQVKS